MSGVTKRADPLFPPAVTGQSSGVTAADSVHDRKTLEGTGRDGTDRDGTDGTDRDVGTPPTPRVVV